MSQQIDLQGLHATILSKIQVYNVIAAKSYGVDAETAKNIVAGELENYMTRLRNYIADPKNAGATLTAAQGVNIFLEVMQNALSFSAIANHVYISRMKGTGTAIGYKTTADGEIYQAQKAGAISHLSDPVLVQIGEQFAIESTQDGKHIAKHTLRFDGKPKFSLDNFLVGYVYVIYPNNDRELTWIGAERMKELQAKSSNKGMYNDESFVQTKVIKHALRKVRKTPFMQQLQAEDDEVIQNNMVFEEPTSIYAPTMIVEPAPQYVPPVQQQPAQQPWVQNTPTAQPQYTQPQPQQFVAAGSEPF